MNRRDFFQLFIGGAGLVALANTFKPAQAKAEERRRGGGSAAAAGPVLVDPNSADAKQVSYVHKHSDIKDKKVQLDRQGVKWVDQKCVGCSFYQKRDKDNTVAGMAVGGCAMPFATGKVVADAGWCMTWAKK
jgi:hypothetical protein